MSKFGSEVYQHRFYSNSPTKQKPTVYGNASNTNNIFGYYLDTRNNAVNRVVNNGDNLDMQQSSKQYLHQPHFQQVEYNKQQQSRLQQQSNFNPQPAQQQSYHYHNQYPIYSSVPQPPLQPQSPPLLTSSIPKNLSLNSSLNSNQSNLINQVGQSRHISRNEIGYQGLRLQNDVVDRYGVDYKKSFEILQKFKKQAEQDRRSKMLGHLLRARGKDNQSSMKKLSLQPVLQQPQPQHQKQENSARQSIINSKFDKENNRDKENQSSSKRKGQQLQPNQQQPQSSRSAKMGKKVCDVGTIARLPQASYQMQPFCCDRFHHHQQQQQQQQQQQCHQSLHYSNCKHHRSPHLKSNEHKQLKRQKRLNHKLKLKYQKLRNKIIQSNIKSIKLHQAKFQEPQRQDQMEQKEFCQKIDDLSEALHNMCSKLKENNQKLENQLKLQQEEVEGGMRRKRSFTIHDDSNKKLKSSKIVGLSSSKSTTIPIREKNQQNDLEGQEDQLTDTIKKSKQNNGIQNSQQCDKNENDDDEYDNDNDNKNSRIQMINDKKRSFSYNRCKNTHDQTRLKRSYQQNTVSTSLPKIAQQRSRQKNHVTEYENNSKIDDQELFEVKVNSNFKNPQHQNNYAKLQPWPQLLSKNYKSRHSCLYELIEQRQKQQQRISPKVVYNTHILTRTRDPFILMRRNKDYRKRLYTQNI